MEKKLFNLTITLFSLEIKQLRRLLYNFSTVFRQIGNHFTWTLETIPRKSMVKVKDIREEFALQRSTDFVWLFAMDNETLSLYRYWVLLFFGISQGYKITKWLFPGIFSWVIRGVCLMFIELNYKAIMFLY